MTIEAPEWMHPHIEAAAMLSAAVLLEQAAQALENIHKGGLAEVAHAVIYYRQESERISRQAVELLKASYSSITPTEEDPIHELGNVSTKNGDDPVSSDEE